MSDPVCPKTGAPMYRGVRPMTLACKDQSITIDMPGWYCDSSDEGIHTGQDVAASDRALNRLKARMEGLLEPEEIRRINGQICLLQNMSESSSFDRSMGRDGELQSVSSVVLLKYRIGRRVDPTGVSTLLLSRRINCTAIARRSEWTLSKLPR